MTLALSIVSHGHGAQVLSLLALLVQSPQSLIRRVWVTLNTPEPALTQALAAPDAAWRGRLDVRVLMMRIDPRTKDTGEMLEYLAENGVRTARPGRPTGL